MAAHLARLMHSVDMLELLPAKRSNRPVSLWIEEPDFGAYSSCAGDARLVGTIVKVEHYLHGAYMNACVQARLLGLDEIAGILQARILVPFSLLDRVPVMAAPFTSAP